jgi:hypothetical protein
VIIHQNYSYSSIHIFKIKRNEALKQFKVKME